MTGESVCVLAVADDAVVAREGYRRLLELNVDVRMCGEAARRLLAAPRIAALTRPTT